MIERVPNAACLSLYVDGLDTWQPTDPNDYRDMGQIMAHVGYVRPNWEKPGEAA